MFFTAPVYFVNICVFSFGTLIIKSASNGSFARMNFFITFALLSMISFLFEPSKEISFALCFFATASVPDVSNAFIVPP